MSRKLKQYTYRYQKLLIISWVVALLITLGLPQAAFAWKPTTHVYLGQQALADALDDGKVTIYQVDYARGAILRELGQYQVDPTILAALQSNEAQYRAGILGPDAYPDILTGQQVIHPSPEDTHIAGGSNAWISYLWGQSLMAPNNTPAIKAFTVGYLTHAAGDMFGHTFINNFAGGHFAITPPAGPANAIKHIIVEGYVDKRLERSALDANFFNASIAGGVDNFIYQNMVDARPGSVLDRQLLTQGGGGTDYSVPRIYSTLRTSLQRDIDVYYATKNDYLRRIDGCAWFDFSCSKVALSAELAAYVVANGAIVTYKEAWRDDIDSGLRAWPGVSHEVAKVLFFNPNRKADTDAADAILQRYVAEHLISMSGAPDAAGAIVGAVLSVLDALDFLAEPIRQLKEDILNTMLKQAIGMTKTELKEYFTSPDKYFDQILTGGAGEHVTLQQFNAQYLHITDPGYTNPNEAFDYRNVPAAYNTVTMSKLIFLGPGEVNRLLRDLGSQASLTTPNIMLGFIQTLDGDNQWANGMVLAQDCNIYQQIFMRQPGEHPLPGCQQGTGGNPVLQPLQNPFVESDRFTVRNLALNGQGNVLTLNGGGTIRATLEVNHNCPGCGGAINQIIVGLGDENGAQACVWNGGSSSSGWQTTQFDLTVPTKPGVYYVRTRYAQAFGCSTSLGWWKVDRPAGPTQASNIGAVIVR